MARIDTEIEGEIINSDELYRKAGAWANNVRMLGKSNASVFASGKLGTYTYPQKTKWHKKGEKEPKLSQSLSYKVKEVGGIVDGIKFQFPRHGVFRAYGVGNGQPVSGVTAKKSFKKRSMSDWIDAPIDQNIEKIADIAAEFYGDTALVNTYNTMKIVKN